MLVDALHRLEDAERRAKDEGERTRRTPERGFARHGRCLTRTATSRR